MTDKITAHEKSYLKVLIERDEALKKLAVVTNALALVAAPKRPDGTYNRDREACEQLAREALKEIEIGELFEQLKEARAKVDELTLTPNGRDKE